MKPMKFIVTVLAAVVLAALTLSASSANSGDHLRFAQASVGNRVALVIGNASYPDDNKALAQPIKDARALAEELRRSGFEVILGEDLTKQKLRAALDNFKSKIRSGSAALFFFSGYGIQTGKQSYIIPVDAQIWTEGEVKRDGVTVESILNDMNAAGATVKVVIIDAARRNPFERRFRGFSAGLASLNAPAGTLAMYAAATDKVANESDGEKSLFVSELLKEMRSPGSSAETIFNNTRMGVSRASKNEQVPFVSSSLVEEFSFGRPLGGPPAAADPPPPTPVSPATPGPAPSIAQPEPKPPSRPAPEPEPSIAMKPPAVEPAQPPATAPSIASKPPAVQPAPPPAPPPSIAMKPPAVEPAPPPATAPSTASKPPAVQPVPAPAPAPSIASKPPAVQPVPAPAPAPSIASKPPAVAPAPPPGPPPSVARPADRDEVIQDLDNRIRRNPRDADAFYRRGQAWAQRGEYALASDDFGEAIRINPGDAESLNNRCFIRAVMGQLEGALADCDEAIRLRDDYADALDSRGLIHLKLGQYERAIADFTAAISINPKMASALFGRGKARIRRGDRAGGNADIRSAKTIDPTVDQDYEKYGVR